MTVGPVLLVEDDLADQRFIARALRRCDARLEVTTAQDGEEALARLDAGLRPALMVLDVDLPVMDGKRLLERLKSSEAYCAIPAIMFSTSGEQAEIDACYRRGADAYLVKPDTPEGYDQVAARLTAFWLGETRLPTP